MVRRAAAIKRSRISLLDFRLGMNELRLRVAERPANAKEGNSVVTSSFHVEPKLWCRSKLTARKLARSRRNHRSHQSSSRSDSQPDRPFVRRGPRKPVRLRDGESLLRGTRGFESAR